MSLKLAARLVVFPAYKFLDLQENDTVVHIEDISAVVPPGVVAVLIQPRRISGTGGFRVYPMNSTDYVTPDVSFINIIPIKDQELKWSNSTANDDWDVWIYGYFVQKRTR